MTFDIAPNDILDTLTDYLATALEKDIISLKVSGNPQGDSLANQRAIGDSIRAFASGHPLFIENGLQFEVEPSPKYWYDFLLRTADNGIWLPINLKVSSFSGRDDLSSKKGLFYALTGVNPDSVSIGDWGRFHTELSKRTKLDDCSADYYYLVVRKPSVEYPKAAVFWTSLLQLHHVHPNGSRPPFQCDWRENTERTPWSRQFAICNLLNVLKETLALRADAYTSFQKHMAPVLAEFRLASA
jgi:hypothetical protein